MPPVLWPASFNVAGDAFSGIGQKKAAMAVEILERDLGVTIRELKGSDIAYERDDLGGCVDIQNWPHCSPL